MIWRFEIRSHLFDVFESELVHILFATSTVTSHYFEHRSIQLTITKKDSKKVFRGYVYRLPHKTD